MILAAEKPVRLIIQQKSPSLFISADGLKSERLKFGDEIIVSYEGKHTNLIQLGEGSYFEQLRNKFGWGQDLKRWSRRGS